MIKPNPDAGIPLLTEIISAPHAGHVPESTARAPAVSPPPPKESAPASAPIDTWVDGEWSRLERQINERVLQQMMARIDFVLEQRVRDSLADVLQTAVESLATEIRQGLRNTLEDVITRAVSQEINRLNKK
jgi:hypothetical protein